MPASFPDAEFRAFGIASANFFPGLLSDEVLYDPQEKRRHFDLSWQAVRYRYRSCSECSEEFKALLDNPSEMWQAGWSDEEMTYKLERCIYIFFMSALSIFDIFAVCLYFLGNAMQAAAFPDVAAPRKITRASTYKAISDAFPAEPVTGLMGGLPNDARFRGVDHIRNLLSHRISGRRSFRSSGTLNKDGSYATNFHKEIGTSPAQLESWSLIAIYCSVISTISPPCCPRSRMPRGLLPNRASP